MLKMWMSPVVRMCCLLGMFLSMVNSQKASNGFDCVGRTPGYYADINSGCQIYHMCDNIGRRFTYACPNNTLFQQRMLICDHWYMVDCNTAESSYSANLRIGQKGPFLEDDEMAGMRTTRPDLLTASKDKSVDRGKITSDEVFSPINTVGLKSQSGDDAYNLPTFWSTENNSRPPIQRFISQDDQRNSQQLHDEYTNIIGSALDRNRAKAIDFSSKTNAFNDNRQKSKPSEEVQVNYKSNFEATTPVFPSSVEDTTSSPNNIGLEPPVRNKQNKPDTDAIAPIPTNRRTKNDKTRSGDSFESNFKATTPVFPVSVIPTNRNPDISSDLLLPPKEFQSNDAVPNDVVVNFVSNYKATTPVYPLSVEATSSKPDEVGLLGPINAKDEAMKLAEVVIFPSNFKATTPVYPTSVEPSSQNPNEVGLLSPKGGLRAISDVSPTGVIVNFPSNFKATTPVYPSSVEPTSPNPDDVGLLLPKNIQSNNTQPRIVNFASNFKATTPVYPDTVEPTSQNPDEVGLLAPKSSQNSGRPSDNVVNFVSNFKATTPVYPSFVDPTSPDPNEVGLLVPKQNNQNIEARIDKIEQPIINFVSNFKATTPVYPSFVDKTSIPPDEFGLLPPKQNQQISGLVNFSSNFAATTPVYPNVVDASSPNPNDVGLLPPKEEAADSKNPFKVNFFSKFKATTPVYPTFVDPTSQKPDEVGLLPPNLVGAIVTNTNDESIINFVSNYKATTPVYPKSVDNSNEEEAQQPEINLNLDLLPPKFDETFQSDKDHQVETTVIPPSRFYQPPLYEPNFTDENPGLKIANFMKSFNVSQWQELRNVFRIPEYDFPLDDATRPSYDSVFDSFDAKAVKK